MKTLTLFAVAVVLGGVLGALFSWPGVALGGVIAAALGRWPHGLQLGPLLLVRKIQGISPLVVALAEWRWDSKRLDHAAWQLAWLASHPSRRYWFWPEYRADRSAHLLAWSFELPYLGTLALVVHTAIPGSDALTPEA